MISIKIYMVMGQCHVRAVQHQDGGSDGTVVTWQGDLDEDAPVLDLTNHVTNALLALDREMGEVHEMVLFGDAVPNLLRASS